MSWLQPWAWFGLGALAVPVLVHLLSRRPARTVAFPSLRFLVATPLRPTRRTRLSDWPLLVVRLAILLAAVLALAQPVRRAALTPAAGTVSRVRLIDTLTAAAPARPDSVETLTTASLPDGLARALARLRAQPAPRALEVLSTFSEAVADSAMFAALPRDVQLVLTPASPTAGAEEPASPRRTDTLTWRTTLPLAARDAVRRAAESLGGARLAVEPLPTASSVTEPVATGASPSLQEIIIPQVLFSGERLRARAAAAVVHRVATDPVLRALTGAGTPIRAQSAGDTLRLSVASASPDVALALVMAAGGMSTPRPRSTTVRDTATLRRWATSPAGEPIGAGTARTDVHRVQTDARWWWLVVLLLLGLEWMMRRAGRHATQAEAA